MKIQNEGKSIPNASKPITKKIEQPPLSDQEIRDKIQVEISKKAPMAIATSAKTETETGTEKEAPALKNDPKDPSTKEKLKSILSKGSFNFTTKERDHLARILGDN